MECTAAPHMEERFPEREESVYATEGTLAHNVLEMSLTANKPPIKFVGEEYKEGKVTEEMAEAVAIAKEWVDAYAVAHPKARRSVETFVDAGPVFDRGKLRGKVDVSFAEPFAELCIIDYKHGVGTPVSPEENWQLLMYGMAEAARFADFESFRFVIIQPRSRVGGPPVQEWAIEYADFQAYQQTMAARIVEIDGYKSGTELTFTPGTSQCKFCSAKAHCPGLRNKVTDTVFEAFDGVEFSVPAEDSPVVQPDEHIPDMKWYLEAVPVIRDWCNAFEAYALGMLKRGETIDGSKLVRGKSNRTWVKGVDGTLDYMLTTMKLPKKDITEAKLLGIPALEKYGKQKKWRKTRREQFENLIMKPEGKLTIAAESDPRPGVNVAEHAFKDVNVEDDLLD